MRHKEKIKDKINDAEKFLKNSNHFLNVTYPLIEDGKFLLGIVENLFLSATSSIEAILIVERSKKNIPPFHKSFESKFRTFKQYIASKYRFKKEEIDTINKLKDILIKHRDSSIEFSRKEKYIIWNDDYDATTLNYNNVKDFYNIINNFYSKVKSLVEE
ncbi:MAG: hypothetical protein ACOCP4_00035 [Candidatus Woesearchaeota archaeon]